MRFSRSWSTTSKAKSLSFPSWWMLANLPPNIWIWWIFSFSFFCNTILGGRGEQNVCMRKERDEKLHRKTANVNTRGRKNDRGDLCVLGGRQDSHSMQFMLSHRWLRVSSFKSQPASLCFAFRTQSLSLRRHFALVMWFLCESDDFIVFEP